MAFLVGKIPQKMAAILQHLIMCAQGIIMCNPLNPDIKMNDLLTVLHTFLMELVGRMSLN